MSQAPESCKSIFSKCYNKYFSRFCAEKCCLKPSVVRFATLGTVHFNVHVRGDDPILTKQQLSGVEAIL